MSTQAQASLAAATTGILVGAAMVSTRTVSGDVSPETLAFLRYLIGMCVLAVPIFLGRRVRFSFADMAAISILGIFQFALLIVLLNYALEALSATTCALVFSTMPLLTMSLAVVLKREAFSLAKLTGLLLAVSGVGLLLSSLPSHYTGQSSSFLASTALLGATVIGAICSILYRPYLQRYPALSTSMLAMGAAVIFLAGLCWLTHQPVEPRLSATQWANVGFMGVSSGVGYFCWLWALARTDASRVVAFQALGPITATAIELFITRQFPSWELLLSVVLVVCGLLLSLRCTDRAAKSCFPLLSRIYDQ